MVAWEKGAFVAAGQVSCSAPRAGRSRRGSGLGTGTRRLSRQWLISPMGDRNFYVFYVEEPASRRRPDLAGDVGDRARTRQGERAARRR
jgi:hypothetical protein